MTTLSVKVQVDLPDFTLQAVEAAGVVLVEQFAVVSAVESWADAVERAHGNEDVVKVLRTLAVALSRDAA